MKVTLNSDGSVSFDVATAAEGIELARALQNGHAHSDVAVQAVVEATACDREEAVLIEAEADDDEAVAEYVRTAVAEAEAAPKRPSDYAIKQAAAKAAGLSIQHYLVWEYLVDKDSQRGGVSVDQTMRKLAAKAAGLSIQHYVVWEYLVDKDSQRGGVGIEQVMRKFHITRSAANQRLLILEKKGFATRVGTGHYRAATP